MIKKYAESTYKKKLRETGIPANTVDELDYCLTSIGHFYMIIEVEEIWDIVKKFTKISKNVFDTLFPILYRNPLGSYEVEPLSEYYVDGPEDLVLTDLDSFTILKTDSDFSENAEDNKTVDFDELFDFDMDGWTWLDKQRRGKPLYIPADLLSYYDLDYIEETPLVSQLRHFFAFEAGFDVKQADKPIQDFVNNTTNREYKSEIVNGLIMSIFDCGIRAPMPENQAFKRIMDLINEHGFVMKSTKQVDQLVKLIVDIMNNTRLPVNRGYTPNELGRMRPKGGIPEISFGPGIQNAIMNGELDAEEMKKEIAVRADFPMELKGNLISEINKSLGKGEEKWVNGTLIKGEKIRPNDPCPCGSGKKYKKCCGLKS